MKKIFVLSLMLATSMISVNALAQRSNELIKDVLTNENEAITWLGADFSHVKLIDPIGCTPAHFAISVVPAINNVVVAESSKYDFAKYLGKKSFISDITEVNKSNFSINPDELIKNSSAKLNEDAIKKIVAGYDLKGKEGIGVVMIYESLSKLTTRASIYFTYIKMPEGEVILSKQVSCKPGGFGLRNYWAATIFNFLKDYDFNYLQSWKAENGIK